MRHLKIVFVFIQMRELEVVKDAREHHLADLLNECFAKTDTDTT